ncbi:hypothetical protein C8Q77DRAFT_924133 [Trametes polyzona]|nr:hypothetical protein C8Q77DRAFT_924133 [Trametes polyzona]
MPMLLLAASFTLPSPQLPVAGPISIVVPLAPDRAAFVKHITYRVFTLTQGVSRLISCGYRSCGDGQPRQVDDQAVPVNLAQRRPSIKWHMLCISVSRALRQTR